ncbi:hypothetical protein X975_23786, partial [Stegodyphus mimosarum]
DTNFFPPVPLKITFRRNYQYFAPLVCSGYVLSYNLNTQRLNTSNVKD